MTLESLSLFLFVSGFIIGLGAVTVIDLLGFLARKSPYWTEATIRAHKVTKPLIWIGIFLVIIGGTSFYGFRSSPEILFLHSLIVLMLIFNGLFLSFRVSPFLIQREKEGREKELLPDSLQKKITLSFVVSFI